MANINTRNVSFNIKSVYLLGVVVGRLIHFFIFDKAMTLVCLVWVCDKTNLKLLNKCGIKRAHKHVSPLRLHWSRLQGPQICTQDQKKKKKAITEVTLNNLKKKNKKNSFGT